MWSFWIMTSAMAFMTFTLTFAGVVQIHLQRVVGGYATWRSRTSSALFYWMRLGAGVVVVIGAACSSTRCSGPVREQRHPARAPSAWRRPSEATARWPTRRHRTAAARPPSPTTCRQATSAALFEHAWRNRLPLLLKGPTGCGKTRFVAHMAHRLGLPLHTVACHDDLTAADLTGRYLLKGGETVWVDGPLTRAVREGGICYLDEVVEARKDVTVVLHPLTDDRRLLPLERTGELLEAPAELHARRLLQPRLPEHPEVPEAQHPPALPRASSSTSRRPSGRSRSSPPRAACRPSGCAPLVHLADAAARAQGQDLEEGVSTRLLVYCATLIHAGLDAGGGASRPRMIEPLTDDADVKQGLRELVRASLG